MDSTKLEGLDSPNISTQEIISILGKDYIRILASEQKLKNSIKLMHSYFYEPTPKWESEPVIDKDSKDITKEGVPQEILWQYQIKNQQMFDVPAFDISQSMSSITIVIEYLEERFWRMDSGKDPISLVSSVPNLTPPQGQTPPPPINKEGWGKKIQNAITDVTGIKNETPYSKNQEIIESYRVIPETWGLILEYHSTAIANAGTSWSSTMTREGMEDFLQIMQSNFTFWIEPKLLEAVTLGNHIRLKQNKEFADRFVSALAYSQKQTEKTQSFG